MKSYESTAKTVEEAITAGLNVLGASIGDVDIVVLEEGSKGLFGLFGSRQAKVRLTLKETEENLFDDIAVKPAKVEKPAPKAEKVEKVEKPTAPKAEKVEKAESELMSLGYRDFRVRVLGNAAKLQLKPEQMAKLMGERYLVLYVLEQYFDEVYLDLKDR